MTDTSTHPWQVAVYVNGGSAPIRVFDRYKTERDATGYAEVLREQAKRNGWNQVVRVEMTVRSVESNQRNSVNKPVDRP